MSIFTKVFYLPQDSIPFMTSWKQCLKIVCPFTSLVIHQLSWPYPILYMSFFKIKSKASTSNNTYSYLPLARWSSVTLHSILKTDCCLSLKTSLVPVEVTVNFHSFSSWTVPYLSPYLWLLSLSSPHSILQRVIFQLAPDMDKFLNGLPCIRVNQDCKVPCLKAISS